MKLLDRYGPSKLLLISLVGAIFVVYPNIACLPWELSFLSESKQVSHLTFFFIRYAYFVLLSWGLLAYNLNTIKDLGFKERTVRTLLTSVVSYGLFILITYLRNEKMYGFGSILIFQFFVVFIVCTFVGHLFMMYTIQRKKEQEIEQLKIENLQSRCDALANQINPHFFFNSLNGITALIRKKNDDNTLAYVNKLSDVFRYILQSKNKGLVSLAEELAFVQSFRYMMEVRFANKLNFTVAVAPDKMDLKLPILSILPLIDNIVVHNTIDSDHKMDVAIYMNEKDELVVSNPIHPKFTPSGTNGTGLKNLENRFALLMNKQIRIKEDGNTYTVYLPLN